MLFRSVTPAHIARGLGLAERIPTDRITLASIWGPPTKPVDPGVISWWCAGGVVACPALMAPWWHHAIRAQAACLYQMSSRVTFEVNTWASVWHQMPDRFRMFACDHDASLLEIA